MRSKISVAAILGYAVSVIALVFGIAVLADLLPGGSILPQFRIMFGIVLLLIGIYRGVATYTSSRQRERLNDE